MLSIYNRSTKTKKDFQEVKKKRVNIYQCGPTVYWYAHIGNLRGYVLGDVIRNYFKSVKKKVRYIINITDVGHLTGDDNDTGDDKIEKAAEREKKSAKEITQFYTEAFQNDLKLLHITPPTKWVRATAHIKEQIALIKKIEKKGLTYRINDGIYFNTEKYKDYTSLLGVAFHNIKDLKARVSENKEKRNPLDFALWKFSDPGKKRLQEWKSPWGKGFPGWHIECSAMTLKYLKNPIDIHIGGIDHYTVHHPNEIAQAESVGYKPFVNYWVHFEHLNITDGKMAKSSGKIIRLHDLVQKGYDPLAYKYLVLGTHYRQKINFSFKALDGAASALYNLQAIGQSLPKKSKKDAEYIKKFTAALEDDFNTPKFLSILWDIARLSHLDSGKKQFYFEFAESILHLNLIEKLKVPNKIKKEVEKREKARKDRRWDEADKIRLSVEKSGIRLIDTESGTLIVKNKGI